MSKIDERVVNMRFNGEQFSKGVADTTGALAKLKDALNLDGAAKGLNDITAAAQNTNLKGLVNSISEASSGFSGLQVVALGVLAGIGAKAAEIGLQMAQKLGSDLTRDIQAGFSDYNTKLTSVQTIMNATGASIDTVNGYFTELDTYADKTVYNLQDMTGAFAKFTNAGVGMDKSVPAIKGIANMVALAGQGAGEASIAMYNLSQSIAGGFLTTTDYKSLNLANVATKEWKDQMIAGAVAAGTLKDAGGGMYEIMADGSGKVTSASALFNEELARGWANTDVLLGVLGKYGDETTDIGNKALAAAQNVKSLPMMMETLAAAAGTGWTTSFELILGNVTEATELFTYLTNEIGGFTNASADARNAQLQLWKDMGGRTALFEALKNVFAALHSVLGPIGEAWKEVFPPSLGKTLAAISFAIRDFTAGLILSENAQANLKMVAKALFSVLSFGVDIIMGVVRILGFFVGLAFDLAGALLSLIGPVLTFVRSFIPVQEGAEETGSAVDWLVDRILEFASFLTGWIPDAIRNFGGLLNNLLNEGGAQARIKEFMNLMRDLGQTFAMVYNVLAKGDFTSNPFFSEDSQFVDILFRIREGVLNAVDAFKQFGEGVADATGRAVSFWDGVLNAVKAVWAFIQPVVEGIGNFFKQVMDSIDPDAVLAGINVAFLVGIAVAIGKVIKSITGIFDSVGGILDGVTNSLDALVGVLEGYQLRLKADALIRIAGAIGILSLSLLILSSIDPARLEQAAIAMGIIAAGLIGVLLAVEKVMAASGNMGSWADTFKSSFTSLSDSVKNYVNAKALVSAATALLILAAAVVVLAFAVQMFASLSPEELARGLTGIAVSIGLLVAAAMILDKMKNSIMSASFALNIMAGAVILLAGAVALFGLMPIDVLIQGMIAMTLVLGALVGAAVLLSKFAPDMILSSLGLVAMALALNMLVAPLVILGLLPIDVLSQGLLALAILLGGLVVAAMALSAVAPTMAIAALGILAMAVAINLLVAPLTILGALPFEVLVQGILALAAVMAVLVIAALAMSGAVVGAAGMIAMAAAIILLSIALAILAGIGLEGIAVALIGLIGAIVAMAVISAVLTPLIPVMAGVAGVMALFALGAIALAAAVVIMALGLMLLGPAITLATAGLKTFAAVAPSLLAAVPTMLALGAGLLVFGAGAIAAGAGALLLGVGLVILGAGLALVAAVGIIGAFAMTKVVEAVSALLIHIPGMIAMSGAFLTLGAATLVLGAGLTLLGVGGILAAAAMALLIPLGAAVQVSINLIIKSIERLAPMSGQIDIIAGSLGKLGAATVTLADSGRTAASGLLILTVQFGLLSSGAVLAGAAVAQMAAMVGPAIAGMIAAIARGPIAFVQFAQAVVVAMQMMNAGFSAGANQAIATASGLGRAVGSLLVGGIASSYGSVFGASVELGGQMVAGMNRGLQNGSGSVSAMAARVARTALQSAKRELGVASPSKEFTKIGMWSDVGLANGMLKHMDKVDDAGSRVGSAALNAVRSRLEEMKSAIDVEMNLDPTIRPVLDITEFRKDASALSGLLSIPTLTLDNNYATADAMYSAMAASAENDVRTNDPVANTGDTYVYNQTIMSPKAVSQGDVYRSTNNLLSVKRKELSKINANATGS